MNALTIAAKTMTTREIAELTGKEHKNVLADARKMLEDLGSTSADFSADLPDAYGRPQAIFRLPKRETLILVSGYSVAMRAKIIDRWQELEAVVSDPMVALNDPAYLRGALLGYTEKVLALQSEVRELTPKAEALDRISTRADGAMCITDAAKTLQVRPKDLFAWMSANDYIYRRAGSATWVAYQGRLQSGVLEHKTSTVERPDGTEKVVTQVLVTAKGLAKLSERFTLRAAAKDTDRSLKA